MTSSWDLPAPWNRRVTHAIGGLAAVGFSSDQRYLLVVSHQGRGLLELDSGTRVARDSDEDFPLDEATRLVPGIGPIEAEEITVVGLWGGVLPASTSDGWRVELDNRGFAYLQAPAGGNPLMLPNGVSEVRAVGFSASGRVLVYATASDVTLYFRG